MQHVLLIVHCPSISSTAFQQNFEFKYSYFHLGFDKVCSLLFSAKWFFVISYFDNMELPGFIVQKNSISFAYNNYAILHISHQHNIIYNIWGVIGNKNVNRPWIHRSSDMRIWHIIHFSIVSTSLWFVSKPREPVRSKQNRRIGKI